jgi:parallel beta-helix repeat protein
MDVMKYIPKYFAKNAFCVSLLFGCNFFLCAYAKNITNLYIKNQLGEKECKTNCIVLDSIDDAILYVKNNDGEHKLNLCGKVKIKKSLVIENVKNTLTIQGCSTSAVISGAENAKNFYVGSNNKSYIFIVDKFFYELYYDHAGFGDVYAKTEIIITNNKKIIEQKNVMPQKFYQNDVGEFYINGDGNDYEDAIIVGYFGNDWASEAVLVHIGRDGKISFNQNLLKYGIRLDGRYVIKNYYGEKSQGDWYYAGGSFYIDKKYSLENINFCGIDVLLKIKNSSNIAINGIEFECSVGDGVVVNDSDNIVFDNAEFYNISGRGVVVKNTSHFSILNTKMYDIGEGGVYFFGGNRKNLKKAVNLVAGSQFKNFSSKNYTYRPAIYFDGVGMYAYNNIIEQSNHSAIIFNGNDHFIYKNKISEVVLNSGDSGAIYTGRDYVGRGTIISDNLLYNIVPKNRNLEVKGIYLDDQASGIYLTNNVFYNVQQPIFVGGGRNNTMKNNYFCKSKPLITLDARGLGWQSYMVKGGYLYDKLINSPYKSDEYKKYANLGEILDDDYGAPKYNLFDENYYVGDFDEKIEDKARNGIKFNNNAKISLDMYNKIISKHGVNFGCSD